MLSVQVQDSSALRMAKLKYSHQCSHTAIRAATYTSLGEREGVLCPSRNKRSTTSRHWRSDMTDSACGKFHQLQAHGMVTVKGRVLRAGGRRGGSRRAFPGKLGAASGTATTCTPTRDPPPSAGPHTPTPLCPRAFDATFVVVARRICCTSIRARKREAIATSSIRNIGMDGS